MELLITEKTCDSLFMPPSGDRSLLSWCEKSSGSPELRHGTDTFRFATAGGLSRPKGYGLTARGSNDKPEMGLQLSEIFKSEHLYYIGVNVKCVQ